MNFKGGVIVIGSLLWDDSPLRNRWRKSYLQDESHKISVPLRIRYGRESRSRNKTYTMMFSNHHSTELGQGYILPFKEDIRNAEMLESQAFALAAAEGIWKEKPSLTSSWGAVGLLINPSIEDSKSLQIIKDRWTTLYRDNKAFSSESFRIENEASTINADGFLNIEWTNEMNGFDFIIATPVVPKPKRIVTVEEIAKRVNEYFYKNSSAGISTFQDKEILKHIESL